MFRYDDFPSPGGIEIDEEILGLFSDCGASLLVSVVPFLLFQASEETERDPQSLLSRFLLDGTVLPAQHGFDHSHNTDDNGPSEFSGLGFEDQYFRVEAGMRLLSDMLGCQISTFVPPWNNYDLTTLQVLAKLGFTGISTGPRFGVSTRSKSLKVLPATCGWDDLPDTLRKAKNALARTADVVPLLHAYDFQLDDGSVNRSALANLKHFVNSIEGASELRLCDPREALELGQNDWLRYKWNRRIRQVSKFVPRPVEQGRSRQGVYWSKRNAARYVLADSSFSAFAHLVSFLTGWIGVRMTAHFWLPVFGTGSFVAVVSIAVSIGIVLWMGILRGWNWRKTTVFGLLLGSLVALTGL